MRWPNVTHLKLFKFTGALTRAALGAGAEAARPLRELRPAHRRASEAINGPGTAAFPDGTPGDVSGRRAVVKGS